MADMATATEDTAEDMEDMDTDMDMVADMDTDMDMADMDTDMAATTIRISNFRK
jgi:hypothetical protein